jgi:hypothetical protein
VGDYNFYRRKEFICSMDGCPDTALSANSAYLVCKCLKAYHGRCLHPQALQCRGKGVFTVSGEEVVCQACKRSFPRRVPGAAQDQPAQDQPATNQPATDVTVLVDIGTDRLKATGIVKDLSNDITECFVMPLLKCWIDRAKGETFFHSHHGTNFTFINPITKLVTGDHVEVQRVRDANVALPEAMRQFFREVLMWIRQSYLTDIPNVDEACVTFALACPADLETTKQNILLHVMSIGANNVVPILFNEAEMGYMGAMKNKKLPSGSRVLAMDIGGYTLVRTFRLREGL